MCSVPAQNLSVITNHNFTQATLHAREKECEKLGVEVGALRRDLEVVLGQREQLQGMKQVVMRALGTGGLGVGSLGLVGEPQQHQSRRQMLQPGQTLIVDGGFH